MKTLRLGRIMGTAGLAAIAFQSCAPVLVSNGANEGIIIVDLLDDIQLPQWSPRPESGIKKVEASYESTIYRDGIAIRARFRSGLQFKISYDEEGLYRDIWKAMTGNTEGDYQMKDFLTLTYPDGSQICFVDTWIRGIRGSKQLFASSRVIEGTYGRKEIDEKYQRAKGKGYKQVGGSAREETEIYKSIVAELTGKVIE